MTYKLRSISTYGIRRFYQTTSAAAARVNPRRTVRAAGVLTLCFLIVGCGLLDSIRSGWAGTKPFVQTLVTQGVITQAKADTAIRDVDDTLAQADVAEQCVDNITSSGNEKKVAKAKCYYAFAQSFRAILARHNIGGSAQLDRIAAIGEGFILALEQYFHRVTRPGEATVAQGEADTVTDADKALEAAVKKQRAELKAITGK